MRFHFSCLFMALYLVRPYEFLPSLYGIPVLLGCGIFGLFLVLFAFVNNQAQWYETDTFMACFFLAILLSHASHLYLGGTLLAFQNFLPIFLGFFLITHTIVTKKHIVIFLYILTICTFFITVEGIFEYHQGISYFGIEPLFQVFDIDGVQQTKIRIKWLGPFSDPNDLALLFVVPIPFLLARFMQNKVFCLIAGGALIFGIFYTNSRGGLLSLTVAIAVYFILRYRNKAGMILGVLSGACLFLFGPSRMGQISAGESSAYGRLEAWYEGFQMFKQSPLFGVGMGMFTDYHVLTAHNSFVLVMAELGFFGLFFFTGIYWIPLRKLQFLIWGEFRDKLSTEDIALISSLSASLVAVMTSMFFLSRSYTLLPYMLIALIVRAFYFYVPGDIVVAPKGKTIKEIVLVTVSGILFINIVIKVLL